MDIVLILITSNIVTAFDFPHQAIFTLLHSEWYKISGVLTILSAMGLDNLVCLSRSHTVNGILFIHHFPHFNVPMITRTSKTSDYINRIKIVQ